MQMIQAAEGNGELKEYERLTAASTVAETMPAISESFIMLPPNQSTALRPRRIEKRFRTTEGTATERSDAETLRQHLAAI